MKPLAQWSKKHIGYLEGIVSIIVNTALFAFKLWVGVAINSIAMIADAWHTLSDTLTSVVVIAGFRISSRPADREHPYGHGRAELIASIVIGTLLVVVGLNFLVESIQRLVNFQSTEFAPLAIIVFAVSVLFKEGLAQLSYRLGKRINSPSLLADAWHHRSDAVASGLIVIGALLGRFFWWIDGVLGILVSLLILYAAYRIVWENANVIMGESLPPKLKDEICKLVYNFSADISDIHHFHFHKYGDHAELTFHIRVKKNMSVECAHALTNDIEAMLKAKYNYETTIHIEPETGETKGKN